MDDIYLVVYAAVYGPSGYSELSRNFILGLDKLGVKIKLISNMVYEMHDTILGKTDIERLNELENTKIPNNIIPPKMCIGIAPWFDVKHPGYKIGYTMYEFDNVPNVAKYDWRAACLNVDEVWVPSKYNYETFKKNGISNVIATPPFIDTNKFYNYGGKRDDTFRFLSVGEYTFRKGWDLLIPAFIEEFNSDDNVVLTIKAFNNDKLIRQSQEKIENDIAAYKEKSGKSDKCPRIKLISDIIESNDMPNLYNSSDCFVLFTRGEGFGLPMAESMACEVPCIVPANSSYLDFINNSNGWFVDVNGFSKDERLGEISISYIDAPCPEIDMKFGKKLMRWIYELRKNGRGNLLDEKGLNARMTIVKKFSEDNIINVYNRLKEIGYKEKDEIVEIDENFDEMEFDDYQVTKFIESERRCIRSLKSGDSNDLEGREDYAHDMAALVNEFDKELTDEMASIDPNNKKILMSLYKKHRKVRLILENYLKNKKDKNAM